MSEQADRQQKRKVRRCMFVGLGGTGDEVIRRLKREMLQHDFDAPVFQYTVLDTVAFDEEPGMDSLMRLRNGEQYLYIGNYNPNQILRDLGSWPLIESWWGNRRKTSFVTVDEGAGQMRAVGRMGFFYWFTKKIKNHLQHMVDTLMSGDTKALTFERGFAIATEQAPIIYLIFSLCGGTGSGLFLDVAYVLRKLFSSNGIAPIIIGVAMLPGPYLQSIKSSPQRERIQANAYAALMELERLHNISLGIEPRPNGRDIWNVRYDSNFEVTSADLPFDYFYLIDDTNSIGDTYERERLYEMLAKSIFWLSCPETGIIFWERAKNLISKSTGSGGDTDSGGTRRLPIYSSLGISTLKYEWRAEQVRQELENIFLEQLCAQSANEPTLPPYLNSATALIEEVSGEKTQVNPMPRNNELPPTGTFRDQTALGDSLKEITKTYQTVLNKVHYLPIWERKRSQCLQDTKKTIDKGILEGLCIQGPVALRKELEEISEKLKMLQKVLDEKKQEQQSSKGKLEEEYSKAVYSPTQESTLRLVLAAVRSILSRIYLFAPFRSPQSSSQARALQNRAKYWFHQRYRWYEAGFHILIYEDIIASILEPLINDVNEQKRVLAGIEGGLQAWLSRNKNNPEARLKLQDLPWFERIRPRILESEQVQHAINSGKVNLQHTLQEVLKKTFSKWPSRNDEMTEILASCLRVAVIEQLKHIGDDEHLAERLQSPELSNEKQLFLQGAECLWDYVPDNNWKTKPNMEPIYLLGYGVDPHQQKTRAQIKKIVKDLTPADTLELVSTDISDELALVKTEHGLMISALRNINEMQHAYQVLKTVKRAPYLHIDYTEQVVTGYKPLVSLESTPEQIIKKWREASNWLDDKKSDVADTIRSAVDLYKQANAKKTTEPIEVDNENHAFFNFIDTLRTPLEESIQIPSVEQARLLLADMEEILFTQGWIKIEPVENDRVDPVRHDVVRTEPKAEMKPDRVISTQMPGYERLFRKTQGQNELKIRKAKVIASK